MQIKDYLKSVCEQIKYKPIREDISEEIENHIIELKQDFINEGNNENVAEEKAINHMGNPEEIGKQLNKIHKPKLDWKLLLITIMLLCFGTLVTYIRKNSLIGFQVNSIISYICCLIVGVILSIPIYFLDYRKILKYSNLLYIIASALIIWALVSGMRVNGLAYIYFASGVRGFSPNVVALPLYIISFIGFLQNSKTKNNKNIEINYLGKKIDIFNTKYLKLVILSIMSILLSMTIPSVTSAFILYFTYLIIITTNIVHSKNNVKKKLSILWGTVSLFIISLIGLLMVVSPNRLYRFETTINPEKDPNSFGWFAIQRHNIIETANLYGEANYNIKDVFNLIDEGTNYAVISILAHYGWIATIILIVLVLAFSIKLIINSIKIRDIYGKSIIIGISSMFIIQSIFNILMNFNLWVESNYNLPFVSYGVFNMAINLMSLSLILSVYRRKDLIISNEKIEIA